MNYMYDVATYLTQQFLIFEFSAEDITSDYGVLLRLVNTFTIDTDDHYLMCYKVNDTKTFKNLVGLYYFILCANQHIGMYHCRLARLTEAFKIMLI